MDAVMTDGPREPRRPSTGGMHVVGTQWSDNVARVRAVISRHPEVSVEWPRISGRPEFRASWPVDPADEHSEIRSVQHAELSQLAYTLEREFPR